VRNIRSYKASADQGFDMSRSAVAFFRKLMSSFTVIVFFVTTLVLLAGAVRTEARSTDESEIRWLLHKKVFIYGDIGFSYEYLNTKSNVSGFKNDEENYWFYQNYGLNLKSFVVHPKLLTYTAGASWVIGSGSNGFSTDYKRYYLDLDFLRTRPFHASLRTQYVDGDSYDSNQVGLSLSYRRVKEGLHFRNMREMSAYNAVQRANMRNNNQRNANRNNNNNNNNLNNNNYEDNEYENNYSENYSSENSNYANNNYENENYDNLNNENEDYDNNYNQNNYRNNNLNNNLNARRRSRGFFDTVLPVNYYLNVDRYQYMDNNSLYDNVSYSSSFRMKGDVETESSLTNYFLGLGYSDYNYDNASLTANDTEYTAGIGTVTKFANLDTLGTNLEYETHEQNNVDDIYASATYAGSFKKREWHYNLGGKYYERSYGSNTIPDSREYALNASVGSSTVLGRLKTGYRFRGQYQNNETYGNDSYSLGANGNAGMRLRRDLSLSVSSDVSYGKEIAGYSLRMESIYVPTPRLTLRAFYDFQTSSGLYASTDYQGGTYHIFGVGANGRYEQLSYSSTVLNYLYSTGSIVTWNNNASIPLMYRTYLAGGLSLSRESFERVNDTTTTLNSYLTLSTMPWYRTTMRLTVGYDTVLEGEDASSYYASPSFAWRMGKLIFTANYRYSVSDTKVIDVTEHRVTLKLTRPFFL